MEPKHPAVEEHPEMTQISGMKNTGDLKGATTSALQGHGVDEPEALKLAKQMSLSDLEERTRGMQAKATAEYVESLAAEPDLFTKMMGVVDYLDYAGKKTRPLEEWQIEEQKRKSVEKFRRIQTQTPSTPKRSKRTMRTLTPTKAIAPLAFQKSAALQVSELQKLLQLSTKKTKLTSREQVEFTVLKGDYPSLKGLGPSKTTMEIQDALAAAKSRLQPERIFSRPATPTSSPSPSPSPAFTPDEKASEIPEEKAVEFAPTSTPKLKMPKLVLPQAQPTAPPAIVHGPARRPVRGRRRYLPMARAHPVPTISPTVQWEEDYRRKIGWGSRIWGVMDLLTGEEKQAKRRRRRIIVPVSDF